MLTYRAQTSAGAPELWSLMARPDRWHEWAPHVRGARGLGAPEVRAGARGTVRLLGRLPVPARITAVERGRYWTWVVGPVTLTHSVEPGAARLDMEAAAPLEAALSVSYGPLCALLLRNLTRVAERAR